MSRFTSRLLTIFATAIVVWICVFAITMVSQLANASDRLYAGAGQFVFWTLLILLITTVALPSIWLLRLPPALRYPSSTDHFTLSQYHKQLRAHLGSNPRLKGMPLVTEQEVAHAMEHLRKQAEAETRSVAASVLASTALLQNGRLDGLVVLVSQAQLIWRIARIYGLRPSLKQVSYLYGNVGACVLIATNLDDVDFAELTAPLVHSATPATLSNLPGLGGFGSLLTNSLANGAANAFLTLRVGLIANAYCSPQHQPERASIKQGATRRAAAMLGLLVKDCGGQISQAVYERIKSGIVHTAQAAADSVKQAGRNVSGATQSALQATTQGLSQAASQVKDSASTVTQRLQQSFKTQDKS